jgi:Protein of unknown function (DUF2975)
MRYNFSLIGKLHSIALIWFIGSVIGFIYMICNLLFPNTDFIYKKDNWSIGSRNMFKDGFSIPVKLSVQMPPDTIVNYQKGNASGTFYLRKNDMFRNEMTDSILKDDSLEKHFYYSKWIAENYKGGSNNISGKDEFELFQNQIKNSLKNGEVSVDNNFHFDTKVKMKTTSKYKNFILFLNEFISILVSLFVSFQFFKVIRQLYKEISFKEKIYKRLYFSGLVLIMSQVIKFALVFVYASWYGSIRLIHVSDNESLKLENFNVQFNPTSDSNLYVFLLGLCIIVVSYIFKHGNKIEQENSLTV